MRHYVDQVAQHELDTEGPLDPKRKIHLQMEDEIVNEDLKVVSK